MAENKNRKANVLDLTVTNFYSPTYYWVKCTLTFSICQERKFTKIYERKLTGWDSGMRWEKFTKQL